MRKHIQAVGKFYSGAYSKRENGSFLIFTGGMASRLITTGNSESEAWKNAAEIIPHFTG